MGPIGGLRSHVVLRRLGRTSKQRRLANGAGAISVVENDPSKQALKHICSATGVRSHHDLPANAKHGQCPENHSYSMILSHGESGGEMVSSSPGIRGEYPEMSQASAFSGSSIESVPKIPCRLLKQRLRHDEGSWRALSRFRHQYSVEHHLDFVRQSSAMRSGSSSSMVERDRGVAAMARQLRHDHAARHGQADIQHLPAVRSFSSSSSRNSSMAMLWKVELSSCGWGRQSRHLHVAQMFAAEQRSSAVRPFSSSSNRANSGSSAAMLREVDQDRAASGGTPWLAHEPRQQVEVGG